MCCLQKELCTGGPYSNCHTELTLLLLSTAEKSRLVDETNHKLNSMNEFYLCLLNDHVDDDTDNENGSLMRMVLLQMMMLKMMMNPCNHDEDVVIDDDSVVDDGGDVDDDGDVVEVDGGGVDGDGYDDGDGVENDTDDVDNDDGDGDNDDNKG